MKPSSRKSTLCSFQYQNIVTGRVLGDVRGSVKKLGEQYKQSTVVLYNKANLQLIAVRKPDENGDYQFLGLNTDLKTFIVAFDQNQQYNAVIQDNVVPK